MNKKILFGVALIGSGLLGAYIGDKIRKEDTKESAKGTDLLDENSEIEKSVVADQKSSKEESETFEEGIGLEKCLMLTSRINMEKDKEGMRLKGKCTKFGKCQKNNKEFYSFDIEYLDYLGRTNFKAEVYCTKKREVESIVITQFNIYGKEERKIPLNVKGKRYDNIKSLLGSIEDSIKFILPISGTVIDYDPNYRYDYFNF